MKNAAAEIHASMQLAKLTERLATAAAEAAKARAAFLAFGSAWNGLAPHLKEIGAR